MKNKSKNKNKNKNKYYYMGMTFALAVSFITAGTFAFFKDVQKIYMMGITISSFLMTMILLYINNKSEEDKQQKEYLFAFPITILIVFLLFGGYILKDVSNKFMNALTIISYGLIFLSIIRSEITRKRQEQEKEQELLSKSLNTIEEINNIIGKAIRDPKIDKKMLVDELLDYNQNEINKSKAIISLLQLEKDKYSIKDIRKCMQENLKK